MSKMIPLCGINPYVRFIQHKEITNARPMDYYKSYDRLMLYICEGNGFLQIRSGYVPLRPGTFAIINAGEPYKVIAYVGEKLSSYMIHFDYTQEHINIPDFLPPIPVQQFPKKLLLEDAVPAEFPEIDQCLCIHNMQQIEEKIKDMLNIFNGKQHFCDSMLSGQLKSLLSELFANYSILRTFAGSAGENIVWNTLSYINMHYMEELTNQSIAARLNYHPNYLNRQMVQCTGRSLHQHLIACRLSKAMELLLFTSVPIADIAERTGFHSASRFSKVFQQNMGCSPSRIRTLYSDASDFGNMDKCISSECKKDECE